MNGLARAVLVGALGLACGGPLGWIPGGELSGTVRPVPPEWSFSDGVRTLQLETRPSDPYSVSVWGVGVGPRFYVAASNADSPWAAYALADPRVRLRVGEDLYELRATRTEDPGEVEAFAAALARKYDYDFAPELRDGKSALFRLEAR